MEKKKVKQKKSIEVKEKSKAKSSTEPTKEEDFNFGGLPERDLKKNLGCG